MTPEEQELSNAIRDRYRTRRDDRSGMGGMIILGNISATWIEDVGISCLIGFAMAFGGGMILDVIVGDEFTRGGQDE